MTRTTRRSSKRKNILLVQTYKHDTQDFWCCLCERNIELLLPAGEIQGWPVMSIIKHIKKHIEKYHPGMTLEEFTEGLPEGKKRYPERGFSI